MSPSLLDLPPTKPRPHTHKHKSKSKATASSKPVQTYTATVPRLSQLGQSPPSWPSSSTVGIDIWRLAVPTNNQNATNASPRQLTRLYRPPNSSKRA